MPASIAGHPNSQTLPPVGHRAMDAWLLTRPLEAVLQKKDKTLQEKDKRIRALEELLAQEQAKNKAKVAEPEAVNAAIFPRHVVPKEG